MADSVESPRSLKHRRHHRKIQRLGGHGVRGRGRGILIARSANSQCESQSFYSFAFNDSFVCEITAPANSSVSRISSPELRFSATQPMSDLKFLLRVDDFESSLPADDVESAPQDLRLEAATLKPPAEPHSCSCLVLCFPSTAGLELSVTATTTDLDGLCPAAPMQPRADLLRKPSGVRLQADALPAGVASRAEGPHSARKDQK